MGEHLHELYRVTRVEGGFRVRAANGAFASPTVSSRDEAIGWAKHLAEGHEWARIVVHHDDGSVEREFIYGRDHRERPAVGRVVAWHPRPTLF